MSDDVRKIKNVKCIKSTDKAILVESSEWNGPVWIPQSQVHDDSEVWKEGDVGSLVVSEWFAEKKGWL